MAEDTTLCRMTGVTLHGCVYPEIRWLLQRTHFESGKAPGWVKQLSPNRLRRVVPSEVSQEREWAGGEGESERGS